MIGFWYKRRETTFGDIVDTDIKQPEKSIVKEKADEKTKTKKSVEGKKKSKKKYKKKKPKKKE